MRKTRKEVIPFEVAESGFIVLIDNIAGALDMLVEDDPNHPLTRCQQYQSALSMSFFEVVRWHQFLAQFALGDSSHKHCGRVMDTLVDFIKGSNRAYADEDITSQDDPRILEALTVLCQFLAALHVILNANTSAKDRRVAAASFLAEVN